MLKFTLAIFAFLLSVTYAHSGFRANAAGSGANPRVVCQDTGSCGATTPCADDMIGNSAVTFPADAMTTFLMRKQINHATSDPAFFWEIFTTNNGVGGAQVSGLTVTMNDISGAPIDFTSPTVTLPSTPGAYVIQSRYAAGSNTYYSCLDFTISAGVVAPTSLSYSPSSITAQIGEMASFTPTINDGGEAPTYTISVGTLPQGLTISSSTGIISGTYTTAEMQTVTVQAANSQGMTTTQLTFNVLTNVEPPSAFSYPTITFALTTNDVFPTQTPTVMGTAPFTYSANPPFPGMVSLNSTTGVISGLADTPQSETVHTVTVSNSQGNATVMVTLSVQDSSSSTSDLPPILGQNCVLFDFPEGADGNVRRAAFSWTIESDDSVFLQIIKPSIGSGYLGLGINPDVGGCVGNCMGRSEFIILQNNNQVSNTDDVSTFTRVQFDLNPSGDVNSASPPPQPDAAGLATISDVESSTVNNVFSMNFRRSNTGVQVPILTQGGLQTFLIAFREGDLDTPIGQDLSAYHGGAGRTRMTLDLTNPPTNNCDQLGFADSSSSAASLTATFSVLFATLCALF